MRAILILWWAVALMCPALAADMPAEIDYFAAVGLETSTAGEPEPDQVRAQAIKLGTRPVSYGDVANYSTMANLIQPTAPADCPNGMCPLIRPRQQVTTQPTYYAEAPAEIDTEPYVGCGAEAYAAASDGCGGSEYASAAAAASPACGSAAYAQERRQARWERRKERKQARQAARANAGGLIRRLLRRC